MMRSMCSGNTDVKGWMDNAPLDGVEDMLKTLKEAGLELYVATSKPEETAKKVLEYFQLTEYLNLSAARPWMKRV